MSEVTPVFISVDVEPGPACADGDFRRFKQVDGLRVITRVAYESDEGLGGTWEVFGCDHASDEPTRPAQAARVEDSSDGIVWLVIGGPHGVLLRHPSGVTLREPFLLLAHTTQLA